MPALLGAGLCFATLVTWWPVLRNGFINYDDGVYVTQNYVVRQGLTWAVIPWAFRSTCGGNWHPLTWLSHALDCQWYGLNPAGHHLTSLGLHVLNTGLLFFVLLRLTGAVGRSGFVAALFALHPLRVESVAWVAERKDVLSASFFFLTAWAYSKYVESKVQNPQSKVAGEEPVDQSSAGCRVTGNTLCNLNLARHPSFYYALTLACFALGLMSKPMLVTLPFVRLLLVYWPLGRLQRSTVWRLVWEKTPFLVLAGLSSVVTFLVQAVGGNTVSLPLSFRVSNSLMGYAGHLLKVLWPRDLAVLYPRPTSWPPAWVAGAAVLLVGTTSFVVWRGRAQKYWITGWFWFLGMLVPVSGLAAIGEHWRADRYTYLPAIGLVLALVWGGWATASRRGLGQKLFLAAGALAVVACAAATRSYLKEWENSLTLFDRAIRVTPNNPIAYVNAAGYLRARGEHAQAGAYCAKALLLSPASAPAWNLMASLLADEGKLAQALACASNSIAAKPDWNAEAYHNRGSIWLELGGRAEAMQDFERALRLNAEHAPSHMDLATLLMGEGQFENAIGHYQLALRLEPGHAVGHYNLANALIRAGRPAEAIRHYQLALQLNPTNAATHCNLAQALLQQQLPDQARVHFESALHLDPGLVQAHYGLGVTLYQHGQRASALAHLRQALQPNPDFPAALDQIAWILATAPEPELRQGSEAVSFAERGCRLTAQSDPRLLATLAAAYAEAGRLSDAISAAQKARELARTADQAETLGRCARLLETFNAGRPFHEDPPAPR